MTPFAILGGTAATADTAVLFSRWRRYRDLGARDVLIERFLPLAHKLARRYIRSGEPYEDLAQVASVGLIKAVERFDPQLGFAFTSLAVPTILGELKRYFRDFSWALHVERGAQERARQVMRAQQLISARAGRSPTISELSQYLELGEEEVLEGLQTAVAFDAISLDAPVLDDDPAARRLDALGAYDTQLELIDEAASVFAAARHLPERERRVLYLRFCEDLPQTEIARRMGISQMQVSRLLRRSLARLRALTRACCA